MANSLKASFEDSAGKQITSTYNYVKDSVTDAQVKALMQGMVANNDIYANPPIAIVKAEIVTTVTRAVNLA